MYREDTLPFDGQPITISWMMVDEHTIRWYIKNSVLLSRVHYHVDGKWTEEHGLSIFLRRWLSAHDYGTPAARRQADQRFAPLFAFFRQQKAQGAFQASIERAASKSIEAIEQEIQSLLALRHLLQEIGENAGAVQPTKGEMELLSSVSFKDTLYRVRRSAEDMLHRLKDHPPSR